MFRLEKVAYNSESSGEDEACLYGCVFKSFGGLLLRCGLGELRENMFQMLSVILLRFCECLEAFFEKQERTFYWQCFNLHFDIKCCYVGCS